MAKNTAKKSSHSSDIIIAGGGLVGLTLALSLAPLGLAITVVEAQEKKALLSTAFDGRVSAIALASRRVFEALGVWPEMVKDAGEIRDIRILDNHSPLFLHYDHALAGTEPMGHIVENRHLRLALYHGLKKHRNITLLAPARYTKMQPEAESIHLTLEDGRTLSAPLLVSAEGKKSGLRDQAGIRTIGWDYGQSGIVCTVNHKKHHNGVAVEHFLPAGPFAILPMGGGHHSSLVWTEKSSLAPTYMQMNEADFNAAIATRFGDWLGDVSVVGQRWCYPLTLCVATRNTAPRLALVGDSAHAIHPIAGQGFNLGIRDVASLAEIIAETCRLGLDIGSGSVLKSYEKARLADNTAMIAVTDGLNRLFSNNIFPIKLAREAGLAAVQQLPPLKKLFIRHAMGTAGNTPRLMQGKPL